MSVIRPISDLRNKSQEISELCHESEEPVLITKNGVGDLVVMSLAVWERQQARLELYRELDVAEAEFKSGKRGVTLKTLKKRFGR